MINLPNIDSTIWNVEKKIPEIVHAMLNHSHVIIALDREGPCAESLGLYELLDNLCAKFCINKQNIIIRTCNQLESHPFYTIQKLPPLYVSETQQFFQNNKWLFQAKTFDNDFKTFGIFIGRSNEFRLKLASLLYDVYPEKTNLTFHYDRALDFHRNHLGFEKTIQKPHTDQDIDRMVKLIKQSPIKSNDLLVSYPIVSPEHLNIVKVYHSFFVEIVCETFFTGKSFYPTEKMWRPIVMKTPFIIQGPKNYYTNRRKLGFKTFQNFWDEGFGEDAHDYQPDCIIQIIHDLAQKSNLELATIYQNMQSILDHNFQVFMQLKPTDFPSLFG